MWTDWLFFVSIVYHVVVASSCPHSNPLRPPSRPPHPPRTPLRHKCRPGPTSPSTWASSAGADGEDDAAASLRRGGLDAAADIDFVVLSHVHWDHVGTPTDSAAATFLVGGGTLEVLREGAGPRYPGELFNSDELPWDRTRDFPPIPGREDDGDGKGAGVRTEGYDERYAPSHTPTPEGSKAKPLPCMVSSPATVEDKEEKGAWKPPASFPHTLDLYGDGSVYVVDAPGHIYGHVNLLVRIRQDKYVCLGGDCCHDPRILAGEKEFAEYPDGQGAGLRSVHTDTAIVRNTLDRIKKFAETGVEIEGRRVEIEVVVAHDGVSIQGPDPKVISDYVSNRHEKAVADILKRFLNMVMAARQLNFAAHLSLEVVSASASAGSSGSPLDIGCPDTPVRETWRLFVKGGIVEYKYTEKLLYAMS
ncbi:hypothetical protein PG996_008545 [Apiospora saccharicola]|uniref:Metallo-beta-lactamase domain-containing protein n=1 Tax=Apiospora saccharicola TaxID=335842 RepID=A0ABR1UY90_9PEZI